MTAPHGMTGGAWGGDARDESGGGDDDLVFPSLQSHGREEVGTGPVTTLERRLSAREKIKWTRKKACPFQSVA